MKSNFVLHVDIEFLEEIAMEAQVYTEEDNDMAQVLFGDWYSDNSFHIFSLNPENYSPPEDPEKYPEGQRIYDICMAIVNHFNYMLMVYGKDYIIVELND